MKKDIMVSRVVWCLLGGLLCTGPSVAQDLDDSWTVSVAGQAVTVNPNGTFRISNILAPDSFGAGGPGTSPDFLSDDFLRVLANKTVDGETLWAFSAPFQIRQGQTFRVPPLHITAVPPPLPQALRIEADRSLLGAGDSVVLRVIGTLLGGSEIDVTRQDSWTTYRTSNTDVLRVGPDGQVDAIRPGVAIVTAGNEGASASKRFEVAAQLLRTNVEGRVLFDDGSPAFMATVSVAEFTGLTNAEGRFLIQQALVGPTLVATASIEVGNRTFSGSSNVTMTIPNGNTDVGDIILRDAVFETDYGNIQFLSDDDFTFINLTFPFPFYGIPRTGVFVGSNGYITFDQGDTEYVESIVQHLGPLPRISVFFDDLDPRITPGGVFVNTLTAPNRLVVTWDRLPEYPAGSNPPANTLQAVLFESGRIQFGYAGMVAPDAIVGLSPGSSPPFSQVDYSELDQPLILPPGNAVLEQFSFSPFDLDGGFLIFDPTPEGGYAVRFLPGSEPSSTGIVRGRVLGATGEPLANSPVDVRTSRSTGHLRVVTDAMGYYQASGVPFGGVVRVTSVAWPRLSAALLAPAGERACVLDVRPIKVPSKP